MAQIYLLNYLIYYGTNTLSIVVFFVVAAVIVTVLSFLANDIDSKSDDFFRQYTFLFGLASVLRCLAYLAVKTEINVVRRANSIF